MSDLSLWQYSLIALIFIWSGFVRSGFGFGGALLSMPFILLVDNRPIVYLPIISCHLLFFASLTVYANNRKAQPVYDQSDTSSDQNQGTVDWHYLLHSLKIMIIPKLIGVFGVITLPATLMSSIIFIIASIYSLSYIFNKPFKSKNRALDALFLSLGAYISGTSLIGAPLVIAVYSVHVAKHQLRDTLFVLWIILVAIKMTAFIGFGVDLQLIHALLLLPFAGLGHILGLKVHAQMLQADTTVYLRIIGSVLLITSAMGLIHILFFQG